MAKISLQTMKDYLSKSLSSSNNNKLNGVLAEIDFRNELVKLNFSDKVSPGGWIIRSTGQGNFGDETVVLFPAIIESAISYPINATNLPEPPRPLHTICATFHQIGIKSYYCYPVITKTNDHTSIEWYVTQLGVPQTTPYMPLFSEMSKYNFEVRKRKYNFLNNNSIIPGISSMSIAEEFTKEHLRISFQSKFLSELSDVDGVFWGNQYTYPIEIKEKTVAVDPRIGEYFGLDVGPFVKLAYYAAKRGNLHSLFVVREIEDTNTRKLVEWRYITFEKLAQCASWIPVNGGTNMRGGGSSVVRIPKTEFSVLNQSELINL